MASSKLLRNEIRTATNGRMFSTWAFVTPGWHPTITEFLVHGCDLKMRHLEDAPEKHMHDASHEVALYALDPRTPLDHTRSLFHQPQLNVLGDARISYQVGMDGDNDFLRRVNKFLGLMMRLELPPFCDDQHDWDALAGRHDLPERRIILQDIGVTLTDVTRIVS